MHAMKDAMRVGTSGELYSNIYDDGRIFLAHIVSNILCKKLLWSN